MPWSCRFQYFPEKAISVSALRVMSKTPEGSCLRHSASVLKTFAMRAGFRRWPASEKRTIVTSFEPLFAAAATLNTEGFFHCHTAKPATAAAAPARKTLRRGSLAPSRLVSRSRSESNIIVSSGFAFQGSTIFLFGTHGFRPFGKLRASCGLNSDAAPRLETCSLLLSHIEIGKFLAQVRELGRDRK